MRPMLTAHGIVVVIVLTILNGIAWLVGRPHSPQLVGLFQVSLGYVLGMLGTSLWAFLYGPLGRLRQQSTPR